MSQQYQRIYNAKTITGLRPSAGSTEIFNCDVLPGADVTYDLGSSAYRWQEVYSNDVIASNNINAANEMNCLTLNAVNDVNCVTLNADNVNVANTLNAQTSVIGKSTVTSTNDTTSKTDANAALKVNGGVAIAKRCWADAFQADTEVRTTSLVVSGSTTTTGNSNITGNLSVTGTSTLTGNVTTGNNLSVTGTSALTGNVTTTNDLRVNGNLGVGIAPTSKLHVSGAANITGNTTVGGTLDVTSNATANTVQLSGNKSITSQGSHLQYNRSGTDYETWIINQPLTTTVDSGIRLGTSTSGNVITELVRVRPDASVGINETNPSAQLHVVSKSTSQQAIVARFLAPTATPSPQESLLQLGYDLSTDTAFLSYIRQGLNNTNNCIGWGHANVSTSQMIMNRSGNVGIGVTPTTISAKLDVAGGILARANDSISNQGAYLQWNRSGFEGETWIINQKGGGNTSAGIRFGSSTASNVVTEYMRIVESTGNVGIGTTSPNALLQLGNTVTNRKFVLYETVNNDHQYYGLGINPGVFRYQVDNTVSNHVFYAAASSSSSNELMRITGSGNVGIGTGSTVNAKLHVAGNVAVNTSVTPRGNLHLASGTSNNNIVIEAGATSDGANAGFTAINFNGYYSGAESRINLSKNRWRIVCSQTSTNDTFSIDTFDGTNFYNPFYSTNVGRVALGYSNSIPTLTRNVTLNNTVRVTGSSAIIDFGDDTSAQIYRPTTSQELRLATGGTDRFIVNNNNAIVSGVITNSSLGTFTATSNPQILTTAQTLTGMINCTPLSAGTTQTLELPSCASFTALGFTSGTSFDVCVYNSTSDTDILLAPSSLVSGGISVMYNASGRVPLQTCAVFKVVYNSSQVSVFRLTSEPYVVRRWTTTISTISAATTYTVAQIETGIIRRTPTANQTDTVPTYSSFTSAGYKSGDCLLFRIINDSGTFSVTLNANSGGTGYPANGRAVAANGYGTFLIRLLNTISPPSSVVDVVRV